jgi:hypothetical protein
MLFPYENVLLIVKYRCVASTKKQVFRTTKKISIIGKTLGRHFLYQVWVPDSVPCGFI